MFAHNVVDGAWLRGRIVEVIPKGQNAFDTVAKRSTPHSQVTHQGAELHDVYDCFVRFAVNLLYNKSTVN